MARKFLTDADLNKNQLLNAVIQVLSADPSSPVLGQLYFNSTDKRLKQYDGTTWIEYGTGTGGGDASTNTATSVDGEVALFNGTTGKSLKRANAISGIAKLTAGILSAAVSGTDYAPATSGSGALKGNGSGGFGAATINDLASQTADYSANSHKITNVTDPTSAQDAATKTYVDAAIQGLSWKKAVRAASTTNGTLASAYANGSVIDGVTLATGDRILLKDQTTAADNGIYTVNASGAPTRAVDADSGTELVNATVYISEGTANADRVFTCTTNAPITPGTTALTFVEVNGGTVPTATTSVAGKVQLATQAEAEAKSDTGKAVVSADLLNFPIKKIFTIGDGSSTSIACTHSLGTKEVIVMARDAATDAVIECDIVMTSTSVATLSFAVAPASNAIKVVIIG